MLTWRRVLSDERTEQGRRALAFYQSNRRHRIYRIVDESGKPRSYTLEYKNGIRIEGLVSLRAAKAAAEKRVVKQAAT